MFCGNCGTQNNETAGFCAKCGTPLKTTTPVVETPVVQETVVMPQQAQPTVQPLTQTAPQVAMQEQAINQHEMPIPMPKVTSAKKINFLAFIISVLTKPTTTLKNKLNDFEDIKLACIFTALVSALAMFVNAIISIYNTIYVNTAGWLSEPSYEFVWDNIKNVKWLDLIFKNFIIYLGTIAIIALIYFLAAMVIKKVCKYPRLLVIVAASLLPMVLISMTLSPILGWIYNDLGAVVSIAGFIYSIIILISGINRELNLEDNDLKVYVNLVCLSIIAIAGYYILIRIISSAIINGTSDILTGILS